MAVRLSHYLLFFAATIYTTSAIAQVYLPPPTGTYSCPPYCGPGVIMPVPNDPGPDYYREYRRYRDYTPRSDERRMCLDDYGRLVPCRLRR
jgi:hypothetical protein